MREFTRREFMWTGSVLAGFAASLLTPGGRTLSVGKANAAAVDFAESSCNARGDKAGKKILVAYASKYGSTGGVADAIGKELCSKGAAVDVLLMKNGVNLSSYQGVIVGSPVYMGRWLPEAVDFVKKNSEVLRQVPVAYFLVCMTLLNPTEENRAKVLAYLDPVLKAVPEIKPAGIGAFVGALDYNNLSWLNKKIMKSKGAPEGDFRDWKAIRTWAEESAFAKSTQ
jgi:menaquinone-dependent protoporphyrinogen oxidase